MVDGEIIPFKRQVAALAELAIPFDQTVLRPFPRPFALKVAPCLASKVMSSPGVVPPIVSIKIVPHTVDTGIGVHRDGVSNETTDIPDDSFAREHSIERWFFLILIKAHFLWQGNRCALTHLLLTVYLSKVESSVIIRIPCFHGIFSFILRR